MNFDTSSQHKRWTFTTQQLIERREANRERAIEEIKKLRESEQQAPKAGAENGTKPKKKSGKSKPITVEDEGKLLQYYAGKIADFCQTISLPPKVKATAQMYLKRFYLSFSALDFSPALITIACIYLAGKIEESYISAESLAKFTRQDESLILAMEPILLEGLKLDLIVYAPFRSLSSFHQILGDERSSGEVKECGALTEQDLKAIKDKSFHACNTLLLTDAPLIFPPSQIALAALRSSMKNYAGLFPAMLTILNKQTPGNSTEVEEHTADVNSKRCESLQNILSQIDAYGVQGSKPLNPEEVKQIDRQLKLFHNPVNDPNSKGFQKRKEEEKAKQAQAKAEKRAAKRARIEATTLESLGPPLLAETAQNLPDLHAPAV